MSLSEFEIKGCEKTFKKFMAKHIIKEDLS